MAVHRKSDQRRDDFTRVDYLNVRTVPVMGRLWDCDDLGQGRNFSIDVGNQIVVEMCYDHSP